MSIAAINPTDILASTSASASATGATAPANFSSTLKAEFDDINGKLAGAEQALQSLAIGRETNLHHVMLTLEEAKLSFQLLMQVRNKVLDAYQEIMRTQV